MISGFAPESISTIPIKCIYLKFPSHWKERSRRAGSSPTEPPADQVRPLIPKALDLVTHNSFAFWNVAVCEVNAMRPKGMPSRMGVNYRFVAYRVYVRFQLPDGEPVEGLYFLRSDCDHPFLATGGRLLTDFQFHSTPIGIGCNRHCAEIAVNSPEFPAEAMINYSKRPELAWNSPFETIADARAFLTYQPNAISVRDNAVSIVRVERNEEARKARLVSVQYAHWKFLEPYALEPEICYEVEPIACRWKREVVHAYPPQ